MKTIKNKIFALIFSLTIFTPLFWSCENAIEFDGEQMAPMIVMNALISPDSLLKVQLSKSKFFLKDNNSFESIDNAEVKLYVNDTLFETLSFSENGNYIGTYIPKPSDVVKITAKQANFNEVSASTDIIVPTQITGIDTVSLKTEVYPIEMYESYNGNKPTIDTLGYSYNKRMNIKVNINDDPNLKNFYRVSVRIKQYFDDGSEGERDYYLQSDDLVFGSTDESGLFGEGYSRSMYNEFSDELFNGKNYAFKMSVNFNSVVYNNTDNNKPKNPNEQELPKLVRNEMILQLHSISESYFKYLKTLNSNSNVLEFFAEPVQIYNNIKGGIGILGSYKIDNYVMQIPVEYMNDSYQYGYYGN